MDDDVGSGNSIKVDFKEQATFQQRREDKADTDKDGRPCHHDRVFIVGKSRWLECRDCAQVIDPFDFAYAYGK